MLTAPIPVDEPARLAALHDLDILYSPPEAAFDRITDELARIFNVSISTIAFIDADRQFYKAKHDMPETASIRVVPRDISICSHVVGINQPLIIEDLTLDPNFSDHIILTQYGVRFYAGAPLRTDTGQPIGSLCIADHRPHHLSDTEKALLDLVARNVMAEVKLRAATRRLAQRNFEMEQDLSQARAVQRFLLPPAAIACGSFAIHHLYHPYDQLGGDFVDVLLRDDKSAAILLADVTGHGASAALTAAMTKTAFLRHAPSAQKPADLLNALNRDLFNASPSFQFMTALAAILTCDGVLHLASAGHPQPLLIRDRAADTIPVPSQIPLLIEPDAEYSNDLSLSLQKSDRVLLYTDGATEAVDPQRVQLETAGLAKLAIQQTTQSGADYLAAILKAIRAHSHENLKDDIALLSIEPMQ